MFQHFGDKHAPVISDELQGSIRIPIEQVLVIKRGCSWSVQRYYCSLAYWMAAFACIPAEGLVNTNHYR